MRVEADGGDREAQPGVRPQLVPGAREGHQPVDHAAPGGHPEHDGKHHAERLRPVRQRGVVQVVRPGPDIEEDQRPEVHDRQPVGIDRPVRLLRDEVVHHAEEAGGQEEAHRVVAVPPLDHRILHAGGQAVGLADATPHRQRQVVHDVQHGDGDDEGEEEPVRHVDMGLLRASPACRRRRPGRPPTPPSARGPRTTRARRIPCPGSRPARSRAPRRR